MCRARRSSAPLCPLLGLAVLFLPAARAEEAKPFLHPLFTDHAVLQRGASLPVWGWTVPGETVKVSLAGKTAEATADAQGRWEARIPALDAGGPYDLEVSGPQSECVKDVLIGDVWICSGQSNMQWPVTLTDNAQAEIAEANFPRIRLFTVPTVPSFVPVTHIQASWTVCSPRTVGGFSAVGFYFGRYLNRELGIPIGLINASWGGTVAEAWTSAEALAAMPDFSKSLEEVAERRAKLGQPQDLDREMAAWWAANDPGSKDGAGWADPAFDAADWKTMNLPRNWEQAGLPDFDGIVWFRRTLDLPVAWAGREAILSLGPIDDRDTTWVNGTRLGGLDDWNRPRDYKIPAGTLKAGTNVIAVRVLDTGGGGGFHGQPGQMRLAGSGADAPEPVSLAGPWSFRDSTPLGRCSPAPQRLDGNPNVVTVLYNGMIAPLLPFAIRGVIWYQGESNAGRPEQYRTLLPTLIGDWRARFGVGEFPFLVVSLANFMKREDHPTEGGWALLREAQSLTARNVPKVGLAVTIDIGDAADIHPRNKQDVGKRLALQALKISYGRDVIPSGPVYKSMTVRDGKARIRFDHVGSGLEAKGGGKLTGFAVAGEDMKFVWAEASIEGDEVVVWSPDIPKPVAVRYAWANNPACNLYNKEGLPADPFRTDGPLSER